MYRGILLHDRNHFSKIGSYYCANIISKHVLRNKVPHKYLLCRMKSANIIPITYLYLRTYFVCLYNQVHMQNTKYIYGVHTFKVGISD